MATCNTPPLVLLTRPGWDHRHTIAVITGALLPTIIASPLLPTALRELEPLVTLPILALLLHLARRYHPPADPTAL